MKYNVNKDNYVGLLLNRPALIRKITSLDEDTAAFFVKAVRRCYEYLPHKLQASVKVVRTYIYEKKNRYYCAGTRGINFKLIPCQALEQLTTKERIALIKRSYLSRIIEKFEEPCYSEWLEAVKQGYDVMSVPEKFHDKKTLYVAAAKHYKDSSSYPYFTIPDIFWKENPEHASESLIEMLEACPRMIHCIPPERITTRHLVTAFQTGEYVSFNEDRWLKIPDSSWDANTVQMALKVDPASIGVVPERYLTEENAIKCAKANEVWEETIPKRLHTRRVLVSLASTNKDFDSSSYNGLVNDLNFQLDVIKEGGFEPAKALYSLVRPEHYTEVLSICPEFIQMIPKLEQTDEIIDTLLGAPAEMLDKIAKYINLSKIKKHHAPLLIGCTNNIILSTMEKKLKGRQKRIETKMTSHSIEIDMAPGDFAKIRTTLEQQV